MGASRPPERSNAQDHIDYRDRLIERTDDLDEVVEPDANEKGLRERFYEETCRASASATGSFFWYAVASSTGTVGPPGSGCSPASRTPANRRSEACSPLPSTRTCSDGTSGVSDSSTAE